jgi:hypothetical protein
MSLICIFSSVLLVLAAFVLFVLRSRTTRQKPQQPACGGCGYPVQGLPGFICPECGCDLRTVGIRVPDQRVTQAAGIMWGLAWTILLAIAAVVTTVALQAAGALPNQYRQSQITRLVPKHRGFVEATIRAEAVKVAFAPPFTDPDVPSAIASATLTFTIGTPTPPIKITWQPANGKISGIRNGDPNAIGQPLTEAWLTQQYIVLGLDPNDPTIERELQELGRLIQPDQLRDPMPDEGAFTSANTAWRYRTNPIGAPYALGFWLIVWLAGLMWTLRRFRRPTRNQDAQ